MATRPAKKTPNPIDRHVGARVRMRRMMMKMSQTKLGDALGITFQQVQKYEKGTNRIGASRMQQIAGILSVPVAFFFEGAPGQAGAASPGASSNGPDALVFTQFFSMPYAAELARHFMNIGHGASRRVLVDVAREIASSRQQLQEVG